jgi:hypothetical protein
MEAFLAQVAAAARKASREKYCKQGQSLDQQKTPTPAVRVKKSRQVAFVVCTNKKQSQTASKNRRPCNTKD